MKPLLIYRLGLFLLDWLGRVVADRSPEELEDYINQRNALRRELVGQIVRLQGTAVEVLSSPAGGFVKESADDADLQRQFEEDAAREAGEIDDDEAF